MNSKIDFLDAPEVLRRKIRKSVCEEGNVTDNGLLSFLDAVLIPISHLWREQARLNDVSKDCVQRPFVGADAPKGCVFTIEREERFGGSLHYSEFAALKEDFAKRTVHPKDLKDSVGNAISHLLEPIRAMYANDRE